MIKFLKLTELFCSLWIVTASRVSLHEYVWDIFFEDFNEEKYIIVCSNSETQFRVSLEACVIYKWSTCNYKNISIFY